jgi:hypothetical protein
MEWFSRETSVAGSQISNWMEEDDDPEVIAAINEQACGYVRKNLRCAPINSRRAHEQEKATA